MTANTREYRIDFPDTLYESPEKIYDNEPGLHTRKKMIDILDWFSKEYEDFDKTLSDCVPHDLVCVYHDKGLYRSPEIKGGFDYYLVDQILDSVDLRYKRVGRLPADCSDDMVSNLRFGVEEM